MKKKRSNFKLYFDRALSNNLSKQALFLLGVLFVAFWVSFGLLELAGSDWKDYCDEHDINKFIFPLYLLIDGSAFNNLYMSGNIGRYTLIISGLMYFVGFMVFTGMLIGVIGNAIENRVDKYRNGLIHYLKSGHYVVMGYDDLVPSIITEIFAKDPKADILLLTSADVSNIKEKLRKSVPHKNLPRIIINYGHRTTTEYYESIHLETSEEIYLVGNRTMSAHDAINVQCVDSICYYLKKKNLDHKPKRITCVFEDIDTYAAFLTTDIFKKVHDMGIDFVPYNFYAGWAKQVLVTRSYIENSDYTTKVVYPAVYGNGIVPGDKRHVHVVLVGATNLADMFAMEAAQLLHFPNFAHDSSTRTTITFIDLKADTEMPLFVTRNRHFFEVQSYRYRDLSKDNGEDKIFEAEFAKEKKTDFLDVSFEFVKGDVFSKKIQDEFAKWAKDENQYLSIFLTMTDQRNNFAIAMNMPEEIYNYGIPVFIRQDKTDNFVTNLRESDDREIIYATVNDGKLSEVKRKGRYAHLFPFGMNDLAYCVDEVSLKRAKLINYLYNTADYSTFRFTSRDVLEKIPSEEIWAEAERLWNPLTVANRWSNLYSADNIPCKLASIRAMRGLAPDDASRDTENLPEDMAEELAMTEHNRWTVEKLLLGFRMAHTYEDKYVNAEFTKELSKNKKLFIHHDIRPYEELDIVRNLDYEIVKAIPWIVQMTYSITPLPRTTGSFSS